MEAWLIVALALITYGSRSLALIVLPRPSARIEAVLARMPPPIFAGLATLTLIGEGGRIAPLPVLAAALGALVMTPRRSLALCLVGGLAGYLLGELVP